MTSRAGDRISLRVRLHAAWVDSLIALSMSQKSSAYVLVGPNATQLPQCMQHGAHVGTERGRDRAVRAQIALELLR